MRISDWSSDVCSSDLEDASARLGVGRRQFYNLLASYRERLKGASAHGHRNGARRRIDERKETVIAQAIEVAGEAARMRDVQALAAQLSRSEEHTSELQSLMRISYAVFCLKKKTQNKSTKTNKIHSI